jgi:hypothetical protein
MEKYGWITWDVQDQRPHLRAVLTMDGVLLAITAPITNMMLVLFVLVLIILYVRVK